jgi:glutamate racemase
MMAVRKHFPLARYVYCSDNKNFPYGPKSEAEVITAVDTSIRKLLAAEHVDVVIIACGTASTIVLPHLRSWLSIEVIGVVPGIKPAASLTRTKVIGLLATPGTVKRAYTKALIDEFAQGCEVLSVGSSELVQIAEKFIGGEAVDPKTIEKIVAPFSERGSDVDTVILACTHFPLLRDELARALPRVAYWVDSGDAIARRVAALASEGKIKTRAVTLEAIAYFTADTPEARRFAPLLESKFNFATSAYLNV